MVFRGQLKFNYI